MSDVTILSQFYLEPEAYASGFYQWLYRKWARSLELYAPGAPVLVVKNGTEVYPEWYPYETVENPRVMTHARGSFNHHWNWWTAVTHGMKLLAERGTPKAVFLSQNMLVGSPFLDEVSKALDSSPFLANLMPGGGAMYTEYFAARPQDCMELWDMDLRRGPIPEYMVLGAVSRMGLGPSPFPVLKKHRDAPLQVEDTFAFHSSEAEFREFALRHGLELPS